MKSLCRSVDGGHITTLDRYTPSVETTPGGPNGGRPGGNIWGGKTCLNMALLPVGLGPASSLDVSLGCALTSTLSEAPAFTQHTCVYVPVCVCVLC